MKKALEAKKESKKVMFYVEQCIDAPFIKLETEYDVICDGEYSTSVEELNEFRDAVTITSDFDFTVVVTKKYVTKEVMNQTSSSVELILRSDGSREMRNVSQSVQLVL